MTAIAIIAIILGTVAFSVGYLGQLFSNFKKK